MEEEEHRKIKLDHMIDEKFGEIFFLARDEFDLPKNSPEELQLFELINKFKNDMKQQCRHHFKGE